MILPDPSAPRQGPACAECGSRELLTRVHIAQAGTPQNQPANQPANQPPAQAPAEAQETDRLLCPNCLADRVAAQHTSGGGLKAELQGGKVVRW